MLRQKRRGRRPPDSLSRVPSSEIHSQMSPCRRPASAIHSRFSSAMSSVMPSRSPGRLKNSRARATKCRDPATQTRPLGPANVKARLRAWPLAGTCSTASPSGARSASTAGASARGWSDEVSKTRCATGARARKIPAASCPVPAPTTSTHALPVLATGRSPLSRCNSSANASAAAGLCAPSSRTNGFSCATSKRPGQRWAATACCTDSSSNPWTNLCAASRASRAFSA